MLPILCITVIFFTKAVYYPTNKPSDTVGIALGIMMIASFFLTYWSIKRSREHRWMTASVILGLYIGTFITFVCAVIPLSTVGSTAIVLLATRMTIYAFVQAFCTATLEEVIFREFIQQKLADKLTARLAIVITAVVFYLMHLTLLPTPLLFGLTAGILRAYSGNLMPSIILHTITNTIGYIAVCPLAVTSEQVSDGLTWSQLFIAVNSVSLTVAAIAALVIFIRKRPTATALSHA